MKKRPLIIGMGGCCENQFPFTMPAIKKAIENDVDGIFINVALTKDKMPVVVSNDSLSKISTLNKKIYDVDFSVINEFNSGKYRLSKSQISEIPTLTEVFDYLNSQTNQHLIINIIGRSNATRNETISLVAGMVQDIKPKNTYISSDSILSLKLCRNSYPGIFLALIINNYFPFIHYLFSATILNMNGIIMSPSFTSSLISDHKSNRRVFTKIDNINMIDDAVSVESDFILTKQSIEISKIIKEKWRKHA